MHLRTTVLAALVGASSLCPLDPLDAQVVLGPSVHVDLLKKTIEDKAGDGPVLLGAQSALELTWGVLNDTGAVLHLPSPASVLRLRVSTRGRQLSVRTDWASDMTVRSTVNGAVQSATLPLGSVVLADGASLSVRGSTKLLDGSAFAPGEYVLEKDVQSPQPDWPANTRTWTTVATGFPIKLHILDLSSTQRQRRFHMLEAGFYRQTDSDRALKHYLSLATMPEARWTDSLPLAHMYGWLGRHREALPSGDGSCRI